MKHLIITILGLMLITGTAHAGMEIYKKIPHDLNLKNQNGEIQSFEALSGDQGIALFFIRSINWCPYCQAQLVDLNKRVKEFEQRGYNVAALSYDPVGSLERFAQQRSINFTLLSDAKSEAIEAFGLLNTDIREGSPHYGIPHPAIVIIGRDKMVQTIHQEDGYKKRPDLDDILRTLVYIDYERRQAK